MRTFHVRTISVNSDGSIAVKELIVVGVTAEEYAKIGTELKELGFKDLKLKAA